MTHPCKTDEHLAAPLTVEPLRVHLAGSDVALSAPPAAHRRKVSKFRTLILTAADPVQQLLPSNADRCAAYIMVFDNPIVLNDSEGNAQATANTGDPTFALPQGLIVPNSTINTTRTPYPIEGSNEVWAAAAVYPTRISLQVVSYVSE